MSSYNFLELILDFYFDLPVYSKTVWKASSKKKWWTCLINFQHPSQKRARCRTHVKLEVHFSIVCFLIIVFQPELDVQLNSVSNGTSFKEGRLGKIWVSVEILCLRLGCASLSCWYSLLNLYYHCNSLY